MTSALSHLALVINAALLDSLWQGVLVVGLVWVCLRCLRNLGAASRYIIWCFALFSLATIPILTAAVSERLATTRPVESVMDPLHATASAALRQPGATTRSSGTDEASGYEAVIARVDEVPGVRRDRQIMVSPAFALTTATLWAAIALVLLGRLVISFVGLAGVRREAKLWSAAYDFPIYTSDKVRFPIAIGFLHPAVVMPASIFVEVEQAAVEAILIHEMAHLRRLDVWTNAFAQVTGALLALNPLAWFLARQMSTEREIACDDWVVARRASSEAFAQALLSMASGAQAALALAAPSALGSRRAIVVRIEKLLDDARPRKLRFSRGALAGSVALLTLVAFGVQALSPALAFAPQSRLTAQSPATAVAARCTQRDFGPLRHHQLNPTGTMMISPSMPDRTLQDIVARYPSTTTYEVKVDAAGHPHDFMILHSSNDLAVDQRVAQAVLGSTFDPARHGCVAVASTYKSASTQLRAPIVFVMARPATPVVYGRNTNGANGKCGVPHRNPAVIRLVRPQLTDAMKKVIASQRTISDTVNVQLDASGAVIRAVLAHPSGQPTFDDATLLAARQTTYAPRIVNCKPVSGDYFIWAAYTDRLEP